MTLEDLIKLLDELNALADGKGSMQVMAIRDAYAQVLTDIEEQKTANAELTTNYEAQLQQAYNDREEMQELNRKLMLRYGERLQTETQKQLEELEKNHKNDDIVEEKESIDDLVNELNI